MPQRAAAAAVLAVAVAGPIPTAPAADLHLAGGDLISGTVTERTADHVVLEHPIFGRLEIPSGAILSIDSGNGESANGGDVALAARADDPPKEEAAAEEAKKEKEWKSHFVLGAGAATGNSENQNLSVSVTSTRKTKKMKTTLDASYLFASSDGSTSQNQATAGVLNEWYFADSPWLLFASARFDYDEFKSWDERLGVHGGVGYKLIDKKDFTLTLRGGAGAIYEWGGDNAGWSPEALLAFDLGWQITERQRLEAGTAYYPSLEDFVDDYRLVSYARWTVLVDEEANLSLNVGVENEYDSVVDPGKKHNDFRVVAGVQFDF